MDQGIQARIYLLYMWYASAAGVKPSSFLPSRDVTPSFLSSHQKVGVLLWITAKCSKEFPFESFTFRLSFLCFSANISTSSTSLLATMSNSSASYLQGILAVPFLILFLTLFSLLLPLSSTHLRRRTSSRFSSSCCPISSSLRFPWVLAWTKCLLGSTRYSPDLRSFSLTSLLISFSTVVIRSRKWWSASSRSFLCDPPCICSFFSRLWTMFLMAFLLISKFQLLAIRMRLGSRPQFGVVRYLCSYFLLSASIYWAITFRISLFLRARFYTWELLSFLAGSLNSVSLSAFFLKVMVCLRKSMHWSSSLLAVNYGISWVLEWRWLIRLTFSLKFLTCMLLLVRLSTKRNGSYDMGVAELLLWVVYGRLTFSISKCNSIEMFRREIDHPQD